MSGSRPAGGGRVPVPDGPPAVAVDIGGTKVAVRAVARGRVVHESRADWPADGGPAADFRVLGGTLAKAVAALGAPPARVGVAAAPTVRPDGTVAAWPNRPEWSGRALGELIAGACGIPAGQVLFGDDATLAGYAEAVASGSTDLVYLGIGTGVGGGLVCGGRLVTGAWGSAGELGHLVVDPGGPRCPCGMRGCLQAGVGARALAERATRVRGVPTTTHELVAGVTEKAAWAEEVLDHAAGLLARALAMLAEIVQPAQVRIGGGLGAALTPLPERVAHRLAGTLRPGRPVPEVLPALLGPGASLEGATLLAVYGTGLPPGGAVPERKGRVA
ncbi:ROK family protein [Streptomyces sp. NPDC015171]|uniref:ROK family protein n=1 Tax=Streptomyces sp. NPDC015171 TaxID=3364945 RepID=UPI0036FD107D